MIVSFSTIEELGTGFRAKLLMPRWKAAKERLRDILFLHIPALEARIIIGRVAASQEVIGVEGPMFVVETRIPIEQFMQLNIREKNDLVLDIIFESIKAAYASFDETMPAEIGRIWQEARQAV